MQFVKESLILGLLGLAACSGCKPYENTEIPRSAVDAMESVVYVRSGHSIGSGVAWADGVVLTAYHVVDGGEIEIETLDGQDCHYETAAAFPTDDLAWLFVTGCKLHPIALAEKSPRIGEEVWGLGHPLGLQWSVSRGIVGHAKRDVGSTQYLQSDVAMNPGMSGGPTLNKYGQLVGINALLLTKDGLYAGIALSVHLDIILRDGNIVGGVKWKS